MTHAITEPRTTTRPASPHAILDQQANLVLLGAAKSIREKGWCQGNLVLPTGERCLIGAISSGVQGIRPWSYLPVGAEQDAWENIQDAACKKVQRLLGVNNLAGWNDGVCKTGEEAAQVLERAAGVVA